LKNLVLKITIAKLYLSRQKKGEKFKSYFTRYYKYLKKHETAINRSNPSISVANTTNSSGSIEHVLLENDNFDPFSNTLEDLLAHEETQSRKRVRVEDIEDKNDSVKIVSIASSASSSTVSTSNSKSIAAKRPTRPKKSKSIKHLQDPSQANKNKHTLQNTKTI